MNITLNTRDYIVSHSEMVSIVGSFKKFLIKLFNIPERKGSIFTVTVSLNHLPVGDMTPYLRYGLVDSYGTRWTVMSYNTIKKTIKIQNNKPIYGLNKKVMHSLTLAK